MEDLSAIGQAAGKRLRIPCAGAARKSEENGNECVFHPDYLLGLGTSSLNDVNLLLITTQLCCCSQSSLAAVEVFTSLLRPRERAGDPLVGEGLGDHIKRAFDTVPDIFGTAGHEDDVNPMAVDQPARELSAAQPIGETEIDERDIASLSVGEPAPPSKPAQ